MILANAALLVVSIGFLAVNDAKKDDAEALKGKWVAVSIKQGGMSLPEEIVKEFKFKFDGKEYVNSAQANPRRAATRSTAPNPPRRSISTSRRVTTRARSNSASTSSTATS